MSENNRTGSMRPARPTARPCGEVPMGGHGPMAMMKGEKARDFKGTMAKLLEYLGSYQSVIVLVMIFAIASTVFTIVGPKILGKATTRLFEGVMGNHRRNWGRDRFRFYWTGSS